MESQLKSEQEVYQKLKGTFYSKTLATFQDDDHLFILMDYLKGPSLDEFMETAREHYS